MLWEHVSPRSVDEFNWSWADERLHRLRELEIEPIAGLLHHGSGPAYTNLLDPEFPEKLAAYASAVAQRYPWIKRYTPVNEPVTTARFSGLYGHWYPHRQDALSFAKALLNQCKGTVLAMREIRRVNAFAELVQTEDMGKTHATPTMAYQAEFENNRRWVSFDLLTGSLTPGTPMWEYLRYVGITHEELQWFVDNPCPPDILGINHYVTSERYLDENLDPYPSHTHGSNGRHCYADVEAVRSMSEGLAGPANLLNEVWERYHLPVAITEAHLGCTREEQVRWLRYVWSAAERSRKEGADIRAVTIWSLLGSYDWDSLLTENRGHYEPGVFDLRAPAPRPTALAATVRAIADASEDVHPVEEIPGWWERDCRLLFPPCQDRQKFELRGPSRSLRQRPVIITGATGTLGHAFARLCDLRGIPYRLMSRGDMDIADSRSVDAAISGLDPWAVINTAGFVRVDDAESEAAACFRENTEGPLQLAMKCHQHNIPLVTFSTDLVFNGCTPRPFVESDGVDPLNVYGRSKALAEGQILGSMDKPLIVRTSAFFGPWDEHNFAVAALRTVARGEMFYAANDSVVSPTYVPHLVHATLDLLLDGHIGIQHLANLGEVTWAEFARMVVKAAGLDTKLVVGRPMCTFGWTAERPNYSALASERAWIMPPLEAAVRQFLHEVEVVWSKPAEAKPIYLA